MILFKPWRWWSRRWFRRTVVCLAALVLAVRLALPTIVRWTLQKVGASQGYRVELEDADFALLRGQVSLRRLEAWSEQSPLTDLPLLHAEFVNLDVDMGALLTGDLRLSRVEVDGVDARLRRRSDGVLDLPVTAASTEAETEAGSPAPEAGEVTASTPTSFDFTLPVQADAVRLDHVRVRWEDQTASPPVVLDLAVSVRLSDLGHADRPARLSVDLHEPQVLNHLRVEAKARANGRHLDLESSVSVRGLHPGPVRDLLAQWGVTPHAERLDFQAEWKAVIAPHEEGDLRSAAVLTAGPITLQADGMVALSLEQLQCQVSALHSHLAEVPQVSVRELHAGARRRKNGNWLVAGMEWEPGPAVAGPADEPPPPASPSDPTPFVLEVAQADIMGLILTLDDETPPAPVHVELGILARLNNLILDPARPDERVTLGAMFQFTDLADIQVELSSQPFAARRTAELSVDASRVNLDLLQPYLQSLGLVGTLDSGRLQVQLQAGVETRDEGLFADLVLEQLSLRDASLTEPFQLGRVDVGGVEWTDEALRVADLSLSGTRLHVSMDDQGLVLPGLRTVATNPTEMPSNEAASAEAPSARTPSAGEDPGPPQRMEVARVSWNDTRLGFEDLRTNTPSRVALSDLDLLLTDLALGGAEGLHGPATSQLRLTCSVEDLMQQLVLEGHITSSPGALNLDTVLELRADGVVTTAVDPLLAAAGLESQLTSGSLRADLAARIQQQDGILSGDAALSALSWNDGDQEHLSLDELRVESFAVGPEATTVGDIRVTGPRLQVARAADGALEVAGLRIPAAQDSPTASTPPPAGVRAEEEPPPAPPSHPAPAPPGPSAPFLLDHLSVSEGSVHWRDAMVDPPVDTTLRWNLDLSDLGVGDADRTAALQLRAEVEGSLDQLTIQGTAHLPEDSLDARLQLDVDGLRAGPLASYLPEHLTAPMQQGTLRATLAARQGPAADGGSALSMAVEDVDFREKDQEEPWFAWRRLIVEVPRMDTDAGVHEVANVSLEGLVLDVQQDADQSLRALGLHWSPPPLPPEDTAAVIELEAPPIEEATAGVAATERAGTDASRRQVLPRVTLGTVDVGVERLRFRDGSAEDAVPLDASLRLTHDGISVVCQAETEELKPLEFLVQGRFAPILESLAVTIRAELFAADPALDLTVRGEGLRGAGLTEVLPALRDVLDGSALDQGRFQADLEVHGHVRRRGPLQIDWSRGIGLDAELRDLRFQATPDGPVLVGLESLHAEVARLDQAGNVHVRRLEAVTPTARVRRTAEGLHVAGLLLKQQPTPATTVEEPTAPVEDAEAPTSTEEPDPTPKPLGPELRLDELLVSGIAVDYRDDSVTPASHVPLTDLELVVKGFTTRAFTANRSVQFQLLLNGGNAEFPKRVDSASALTGFLSATAKKLIGQSDEHQMEQRPVLDQLQVSGRLAFHPRMQGFVRTEVRGLELLSLAGPASSGGVKIGDGVFHSTVDLRFLEDGGLATSSDLRFTDLALSEAPGGPISTYLKLPAPLDTVLYVLKNEKDEHRLSVDFTVPAEGVSWTEVSRVASRTLVEQIANAIAATPLRVTSTLTDLIGIDFSSAPPLPDGDRRLDFAPGTPTVEAARVRALREWAATVRANPDARVVLTQVLSPADVALMAELANPGPEECRALSSKLRQRRDRLMRDRTELVAEALAHFAVGRREEGRRAGSLLQELDRQIAATEASMDRLHALLRPGAERRAARRTREAGRELGQQRLDHVQQALQELGISASRVEVRRARYVVDESLEQGTVLLVPRVPQGQ